MNYKQLFLPILLAASLSSHAQHFEWVRTYTGEEITSGVTTNQLKGSCVDSAGNFYILGEFSPQAQLCGTNLLPFEVIETSHPRWQGVVIAKLSPSGELLWHKAIYNGKQGCYAHALRMVGDSCIMAMVRFYLPYSSSASNYRNLYYLDTLLTGNDDYLMPTDSIDDDNNTAFITLDFDGNAIERHLLRVGYLDSNGNALTINVTGSSSNSDKLDARPFSSETFNIDSEGNIYIIRYPNDHVIGPSYRIWRMDDGTISALKIVVDGTHNLYYPIPYRTALWNYQIMKFSPHFDSLIDAVYMFDSALSYNVYPTFKVYSFEIDAQNNLYVNMECGQYYPSGIRIANSNSLHLGESTIRPTWILRYNPQLEATGLVQLSYESPSNNPSSVGILLMYPYIDNNTNSLFVPGMVDWTETMEHVFYNDDTLDFANETAFWLRLDKDDLSLLSYGQARSVENGRAGVPYLAAYNNRVFAQAMFQNGMNFGDMIYNASNSGDWDRWLSIWDYGGHEVEMVYHHNVCSPANIFNSPIIKDSILYQTGSIWEDATFGDITIHNYGYSQVFIAKYVDTAFMHPYLHPSDRQEQSIVWQQELSFNLSESPVLLTANATSGLPVVYSCGDSSIAYPDGTTLYLLQNGTTTVTASQQGDYYYFPAEPMTKTLRVSNTGIHDSQLSTLNSQISIYPNPTSDALYIIPNGEPVTALRLLSSLGRQQHVTLSNNKINLSHLPAGVYFLSITTTSNSYQFKILKK